MTDLAILGRLAHFLHINGPFLVAGNVVLKLLVVFKIDHDEAVERGPVELIAPHIDTVGTCPVSVGRSHAIELFVTFDRTIREVCMSVGEGCVECEDCRWQGRIDLIKQKQATALIGLAKCG